MDTEMSDASVAWQRTWARFASSGSLGLDWKLSLHHHRRVAVSLCCRTLPLTAAAAL